MAFYKKFSFQVLIRIIGILINMLLIAFIFGDERLFFNQIILSLLLMGLVAELIRYINKTNRELAKFVLAIRHGDFSINFSKSSIGGSFGILSDSFEEIITLYKKAKIEKEAQYQYLRNVVNHINIGILSIERGIDITLMNPTAERLLGAASVKNWQILKEKSPHFTQAIDEMGAEGKRLIELRSDHDNQLLSIGVSTMMLLDQEYKLITLQDIHEEIEEKEIEAWHKLIRILTHEIMNSATPISSLTETMHTMLSGDHLSEEIINDLRFSLKTIQKRSDGMLAFIDDYRKITRVPKPQPEPIEIRELFKTIKVLTDADMKKAGIELITESPDLYITLDLKLIEQVLLNLLTNAQYALRDTSNKQIRIRAFMEGYSQVIAVEDNGCGISAKQLQEIFIPFFSTKHNGSGIGLSLSKQIMHAHGGYIKVDSKENTGTTFYLYFKSNRK